MSLVNKENSLPGFSNSVDEIEKEMLKQEQVDCPVLHHFGPGVYMREVHIPAGTISIGHHQKFEHMNIFLKGHVTILNGDGTTTDLKAPMTFVGKPGRKIGYIHEDMTWVNVYSTNETDIEKLEAQFLEKSEGWKESIDRLNNSTLIEGSIDKSDYEKVVEESGFSKEEIKAQVENEEDMTELPYGHYKIKLGNSKIHGKGLFATSLIEAGDTICPARIKGLRTIAGRFTNHSKTPNAKMFQGVDHEIELVALKEIKGCKGGLDGEEITIDYREALKLNLEIGNMEVLCQE